MARNLRFKAGELLEVLSTFSIPGLSVYGWGPRMPGTQAITSNKLSPGTVFLALSDAKESSYRHNKKLWLEVMTSDGPRVVWANAFKMRKTDT